MEPNINNNPQASDQFVYIDPTQNSKSSNKLILPVIIILVLIGVSLVTVYLFLYKPHNQKVNKTPTPTPIVQKINNPEIKYNVKNAVFKSDTEQSYKYQYLEVNLESGQVSEMSLPLADISSNYGVSSDLKHYYLASDKELTIGSTEDSSVSKKVLSIPSETPSSPSETISTTDVRWSADSSSLAFTTTKIIDLSKSKQDEIKLYTVKADGSNLQLVKKFVSDKINVLRAYDSIKNLIYLYSFTDDIKNPEITTGTTDIIDTQTGISKGTAVFMDNPQITDDINFSSDMHYAYYRKLDKNQNLQLIQYDLTNNKEQVLYSYGKNGGGFLISINNPEVVLTISKNGTLFEVEQFNMESKQEEKLYSSADYDYIYQPLSISPDGHYLWVADRSDYFKPQYAIYDLATRKMTPIKAPQNMAVKFAPMETIKWLP